LSHTLLSRGRSNRFWSSRSQCCGQVTNRMPCSAAICAARFISGPPGLANSARRPSRRDVTTIAWRFNARNPLRIDRVPQGTAEDNGSTAATPNPHVIIVRLNVHPSSVPPGLAGLGSVQDGTQRSRIIHDPFSGHAARQIWRKAWLARCARRAPHVNLFPPLNAGGWPHFAIARPRSTTSPHHPKP
jgi:hypothetical protein